MIKWLKASALFVICIFLAVVVLLPGCGVPTVSEPAPLPHSNVVIPMEGAGDKYDLSYLKDKDPSLVDNSNLPITPVDRLTLTGRPPMSVDIDSYRLTISGLVKNTLDLTYQELLSFPSTTQVVLLICHESHVDNARWTGIPVSLLLEKAGVLDGAHEATIIALDRYSRTLPLDVLKKDGTFVAYKVDDETIPLKHGYPLRLVVKGMYGENWVKWLRQIEVK
ncbi:MAG: molybdopterin-dependent oxidoreductase [Chloroflexi bacterium]|nr:molybdopterin-dependent oxidoreductase [Chloroflexota bacterium]